MMLKNCRIPLEIFFVSLYLLFPGVAAFLVAKPLSQPALKLQKLSPSPSALFAEKLSRLPTGVSPFEKSAARGRDFQGEFRKTCQNVIQQASRNNVRTMEIEFPPLLGGDKSKTQFDDFDNVQELNQNQDWCVQLTPMLNINPTWLIFPDLKECELAKDMWRGQRYRQASVFTCLEEVTQFYTQGEAYSKPWGATFAGAMNQLLGGGGGDGCLLGDKRALDSLSDSSPPSLHIVCQPGNGGPVEDWVNVETLHKAAGGNVPTIIVNGALDKVRDGYYAPFIFPKLAATQPFYKAFESIFYLKPISDKGVYGWVYRVYPEPWQVVLQLPNKDKNGNIKVEDIVALTSKTKPAYDDAVKALISCAAEASVQQR